jgi:hypothetical protein
MYVYYIYIYTYIYIYIYAQKSGSKYIDCLVVD